MAWMECDYTILWTIWTETPAAADRYDASRRALLRDALARERPADVGVVKLRFRAVRYGKEHHE